MSGSGSDAGDFQRFIRAIRDYDTVVVKEMLNASTGENGVNGASSVFDPSVRGNEALVTAVDLGHTEIVRLLLEGGRVDPSARKNECIRIACKKGHHNIVRLLLACPQVDPLQLKVSTLQ